MRASRQAGRILALALAVLVLLSTVWVCLIGAAVVLLSKWLGTGLALLVVAGTLVVLLAVLFLLNSALAQAKPPSQGLPEVLAQGARGALAHPLAIRGLLLLIGVGLALSAVLIPGRDSGDGGPPS